VIYPICPHFSNIVIHGGDKLDGWYCPSHGGRFDNSGRVTGGPAPKNLEIPNYFWTSDSAITIRELTHFEQLEAKAL